MEFAVGNQEVVTKVILRKIVFMDMEKCFGLMGIFIEDGGITTFKMEEDSFMLKARDL